MFFLRLQVKFLPEIGSRPPNPRFCLILIFVFSFLETALNRRGTRGNKATEAVKWGRVALRCTRCVFIEKKNRRKKGKKETQMEKGGGAGERAELARPRDLGRPARARPPGGLLRARVSECTRPSSRTPRAARKEQVGKPVRLALTRRTPFPKPPPRSPARTDVPDAP